MQSEVQSQPMATHKRNEIKAENSAPSPFCRICLKNHRSDIFGDELISPCMCRGTRQFVHRSCFDHWRSRKEGFAFSHCFTCKSQFHLRVDLYESWRRKVLLMSNRDLLWLLLAVQLVIAALAGIARMMDKNQEFRNNIKNSPLYQNRILAIYPIPFYYIAGLATFCMLFGVLISIPVLISIFFLPGPLRWFVCFLLFVSFVAPLVLCA